MDHDEEPNYATQLNYYRSTAPRCLSEFKATPVQGAGASYDGHPSLSDFPPEMQKNIDAPEHINSEFAVECTCGSKQFHTHYYSFKVPDRAGNPIAVSPIALECTACGKRADIFDSDEHGYNAELGSPSSYRGVGEASTFKCESCKTEPYEILVRFEYPDDLFTEDFEEFDGRQHDLFSWITILGKCPKCSKLVNLADYECA